MIKSHYSNGMNSVKRNVPTDNSLGEQRTKMNTINNLCTYQNAAKCLPDKERRGRKIFSITSVRSLAGGGSKRSHRGRGVVG